MPRVLKGEAGTASAEETASYRYDPRDLRVLKTAGGARTEYAYGVDGNELAELGGSGS